MVQLLDVESAFLTMKLPRFKKSNKSGGAFDGGGKVHSAPSKWKSRLAALFKPAAAAVAPPEHGNCNQRQHPQEAGTDTHMNPTDDYFAKKSSFETVPGQRRDGDYRQVLGQTSSAGKVGNTFAIAVRPVQDLQSQGQWQHRGPPTTINGAALQQSPHSEGRFTSAIIDGLRINPQQGLRLLRALRKASKHTGIVLTFYPAEETAAKDKSVDGGEHHAVWYPDRNVPARTVTAIMAKPGGPPLADAEAVRISFGDETVQYCGCPPSALDKRTLPFLVTLVSYHGKSPTSFCLSDASASRYGPSPGPAPGYGQNTPGPPLNSGAGTNTNRGPGTTQAPKSAKKQKDPQSRRWWVCPFFRIDHLKYAACVGIHPKTISGLKDHFYRNHAPPYYCPRCLDAFANEADQMSHITARSCEPSGEGARLDGFTAVEVSVIKDTLRPSNNDDGWVKMWDFIVRDRIPVPWLSTRPRLINDERKEEMETIFEMFLRLYPDNVAAHLAQFLPPPFTSSILVPQDQQVFSQSLDAPSVLANFFRFATTNLVAHSRLPAPPGPLSAPSLAASPSPTPTPAPWPIPAEPAPAPPPAPTPTPPPLLALMYPPALAQPPVDHSSRSGPSLSSSSPVFSRTPSHSTFITSAINASGPCSSSGIPRSDDPGVEVPERPRKRRRTDQSSAAQILSSPAMPPPPPRTVAPADLQRPELPSADSAVLTMLAPNNRADPAAGPPVGISTGSAGRPEASESFLDVIEEPNHVWSDAQFNEYLNNWRSTE